MGWVGALPVWWIKSQEGYIRREESQPHAASPSPGFQCEEVPITSGCKNQWGLSQWKKQLEPQAVPLKEPTRGLTYSDSLALGFSTGVEA